MAVEASQFNDKPAGGGDRAAQHLAPKMPLHRCQLVELLGSFLPRMSNEVACRLVVKLAEGFRFCIKTALISNCITGQANGEQFRTG